MKEIDDLVLQKLIGKGSFGEVYLSYKKGRKEYYATKKIDRKTADKPSLRKYFDNEISILSHLKHPNIVKLDGIKRSASNYYIIMEYINGGGLSDCLKKYIEKHKRAFPEEIVQHLMKQIIDGLHYIHSQKIIHRDIKLDNIMVNFNSEQDKQNLNMLRATIKIIDFGFAIKLRGANELTYSAVGSPTNMDPIILEKFSKKKDINLNIGYDEKADIWSAGTVCYELLIGKAVFNAKTMNDLVDKVQKGSYSVPKTVSTEVVSFLNGMLQYDSKYRLDSEELLKHPFLTKRVCDFTTLNTVKASKKEEKDIKKNNSIWAIFNDEEKYLKIKGGKNIADAPLPEDERNNKPKVINLKEKMQRNHSNPKNNNYHYYEKTKFHQANSEKIKSHHSNKELELKRAATTNSPFNYGTSFYGQNIYPQNAQNPQISIPQTGISLQKAQTFRYSTSNVGTPYGFNGIYQNQFQQPPINNYPYPNTIRPASTKNIPYYGMVDREDDFECSIQ